MSGIKIRGTGRFAPAKIVTNDDLAKIVDTSDEWITTRTGIQTRHHCTTETHTDMCVGAARQALDKAGVAPEEIGACIVATVSPDTIVPSAACALQRELGLPNDIICFDLNAACTGFLFALHTMECLLAQAPRKYGLVIGAEMLSRFINWEDRGTCVLFGDGAGAAVVKSTEGAPWHALLGTRGNREALWAAGKQVLFPLVPFIQRPGGDTGSLADGFERRLFKAACKELRSGAVQDPGINGAVRHCHTIASSIDNLITDNLIINIASLSAPVKGKSSLDKLAFWLYIQNIVIKQCFEKGGMTVAKQKAGVYDKVLECAKSEFLSKGFLDASLRTIAQAAETSTGSIYTRFGDKEGLFRAIAEPVVDQFKAMFRRVQEDFHQLSEEEQRADMGQYTARHQEEMLDYIYDHFDVFCLLLDGAHGTRFACFLDELVDIEVEYTYKYMEVIGCESVKSGLVTEEFIHIIVTAYFNGMFEVVRHNMDRYVKMPNRYHMAGFSTVFDPQP